jgi:Haem-binding domain/Cytochrome P460
MLAALFALAQLIRPTISNPPVTLEVQVPDSVKAVLRKGCYDCHSNETDLKWFDKITPVNFLVADHIEDGRRALNFSNWDSLDAGTQKALLFRSVNDIRNGEMPLQSYLTLHSGARLNDQELSILENYLTTVSVPVINSANTISVKYKEPDKVSPEWNGIPFISRFENWRIISITDRFDNGSFRAIYGNETAVKAISEGKINPWPDGTVFAKAAWKQQADSSGNISMGSFYQVEFMIKESNRFSSTLGWGFGRWLGAELKPYGKNAGFARECVSCHRPLKNSDYTFTIPLNDSNSISHKGRLLSEFVNTPEHTMSILFEDSSQVTWSQRPDPRWFGARIPDRLVSAEKKILVP